MRLLILSDIHANLEALDACMAAAPPYDRIVNLGDIVGYNASPNEVCERVRAMGSPVVRGNHDRACAGLTSLSQFNLVAALSARWTQIMLRPEHHDWLRNLPQGPLRFDDMPGLEFVHGSPRDEDEYVLNSSTAELDFELPDHANVVFFGHTHVQGGFIFFPGPDIARPFMPAYESSTNIASWKMTLKEGERYLLNPGSIGQPRDNDWRAAFALYEQNGQGPGSVTFYRVPYDVSQAQKRIIEANLPERLATRLALGR